MPSHRRLQQYAIAISVVSIFYNGAEGGLSIGFGAESSSRSLIFFGAQSAIEVASAIMVVWRFRNLAKPGEEKGLAIGTRELRIEKLASMTIGWLLILLCLATEITGIVGLALHQEPDTSNASLIISASALVIMVLIWLPKRYLARALDSSTMQGEATCSLSCIQITVALFIGSLIFRVWRGGWWVDSTTALVLGILFGWEGWKMLRWATHPDFSGGCCGACAVDVERGAAGETQMFEHDLCDCCREKNECKEAGECKCSETSTIDVECCTPKTSDGTRCCTHQFKSPPVDRTIGTRDVESHPGTNCCTSQQTDSCCGSPAHPDGCASKTSPPVDSAIGTRDVESHPGTNCCISQQTDTCCSSPDECASKTSPPSRCCA